MSTKERYGNAVWSAMCDLSYMVDTYIWVSLTVGEIADKAGVSKMTARKYLNELADMGKIAKGDHGKVHIYRFRFNPENY